MSETRPAVIDAAHITHQRQWSRDTFGPSDLRGPRGPLAHIRIELDEIDAAPFDLEEWVDVLILALDGAWRAGHEPQQIIDAIKAKQAKNERREWPAWEGVPADQAIEHIRTPTAPAAENRAKKIARDPARKKLPPWWPTAEQKAHADAGCAHPDVCKIPTRHTQPDPADLVTLAACDLCAEQVPADELTDGRECGQAHCAGHRCLPCARDKAADR